MSKRMAPRYFRFKNNLYPLAALCKLSIEEFPARKRKNDSDHEWRVRIHFSNGDSYFFDRHFEDLSEAEEWCSDAIDEDFYGLREWV